MDTFRVTLRRTVDDSYPIRIGAHLENALLADLNAGLLGGVRRLALLTDDTVAPLYARPLLDRLLAAGYQAQLFAFPAGELSKTRATKAALEDQLLAAGFRRDSAVINVGGGVVSDLGGFLAGTFARGVPFVNYATTLLAAADASVGGKTAVDTPLATNLIGLFCQPKAVYIDTACWATLPPRQLSSGLAETIKHGCLAHPDFFPWLEAHLDDLLSLEPAACRHMAEENCRIKYEVVMQDERESGLREVLNLGHTVGRALETLSGYALLHGEAVSVGLVAETRLAVRLGTLTEADAARVKALLARAGLPTALPPGTDREALVQKLYTDKKVRGGKLRFVVQRGLGAMTEFAPGVWSTQVDEATARSLLTELEV